MNCFIYKSLKKDELYLYLDKKTIFRQFRPNCTKVWAAWSLSWSWN